MWDILIFYSDEKENLIEQAERNMLALGSTVAAFVYFRAYPYFCNLFNDDVNRSYYIESQIIWWLMNNELKSMRKEVVAAYFKVLSRYFSGRTEENMKIPH
jgi:hypothetical protein